MHKRVSRLEAMRIMRAARQFREQQAALEAQAAASVGVSTPTECIDAETTKLNVVLMQPTSARRRGFLLRTFISSVIKLIKRGT